MELRKEEILSYEITMKVKVKIIIYVIQKNGSGKTKFHY